jgi:hypothetical protein
MLFDGTPPQVIHLWAAIYRLTDLAGSATISQTELGRRLRWSDDTVARWAKKAAAAGCLEVERRSGFANDYRAIEPPAESRVVEGEPPAESRAVPPAELSGLSSPIERSNKREKETMAADAAVSVLLSFDAFWDQYPKSRRRERANCLALYTKALKKSTAEEIAAGLGLYLRYWQQAETEERFITTSIVWLRNRRWEDNPTLTSFRRREARRYDPGSDLMQGATDRTGESGVF